MVALPQGAYGPSLRDELRVRDELGVAGVAMGMDRFGW